MALEGVDKWCLLPFSSSTQHVPFFCKFSSDSTGFKLLVTDLSNVWEQSRTRRQIFKEALSSDACSIDPSEDPSQYDVLLEKLRSSLSGEEGSKSHIHLASEQSREMKIVSFIPLPIPLAPLTWTFNLQSSSDGLGIQREILLPALEASAIRDQQVESLKKHLNDKDHVISRLMDKIGSSGIDLSMVFPGLTNAKSGKRKNDGTQATKFVAGLAPFDEKEWIETQNRKAPGGIETVNGLLEAIKSSRSMPQLSSDMDKALEDGISPAKTNQRQKSSDANSTSSSSPETGNCVVTKRKPQAVLTSRGGGHDQATSRSTLTKSSSQDRLVHGKSKSSSSTSTATDSGPDENQHATTSSNSQRQKASMPNKQTFEKRACRASSTSSSEGKTDLPNELRERGRPSILRRFSSSTDSDSPKSPKVSVNKQPPSRKLGAVGSRKPPPQPLREARTKSPDIPPGPSSNASTPSRRLGRIGKPAINSPHPPSSTPILPHGEAPSASPPRSSKRSRPRSSLSPSLSPPRKPKTKPLPPKAETEEEKIARKRGEVERIERGPVKKKGRKF